MEIIILIVVIYAIYKLYWYKKNPNKAKEDIENTKEDIKNLVSSDDKKSGGLAIEVNYDDNYIREKNYIDNMNISIKLNNEKNKLLYTLLNGEEVEVKTHHIIGLYKLTDDKAIGFSYDDENNHIEITGVFEVKVKNGRFRAAEYDYNIDQFKNVKMIKAHSYQNPRTWERAYLKNIQIKTN